MPESEVTVVEFYEPVMSHRSPEVRRLVIQLLRSEFKQAAELEANILRAAAISRAEPILEERASDIDGTITTTEQTNIHEGETS